MSIEEWKIVAPFITFFLGFLFRGFTLSKADKKNIQQEHFKISLSLQKELQDLYLDLTAKLERYAQKDGDPDVTDFMEISQAAERYLQQQKSIANAILGELVDETSRDNTLVPGLKDAVRLIPAVDETLRGIAKKNDWRYPDGFKREHFESIYSVVEMYGLDRD